MFSVTKCGCNASVLLVTLAVLPCAAADSVLRICADPNNLPYSNQQQQGFENKLAGMIAADFGTHADYTWFPQRGAFFRKTLDAGLCDVVMGVPAGMNSVAVTHPYYRSGYVFVSRSSRDFRIHSLDDPRLRDLRIGVQNLGDSDRGVPPVEALTRRGLVGNLVSYNIFGNLNETNPAADLIRAVENGQVDVAVAWGPIAGYFALDSKMPLTLDAIEPDPANPSLPVAFDIGIGLRPDEGELKQRLDAELDKRKPEIESLLPHIWDTEWIRNGEAVIMRVVLILITVAGAFISVGCSRAKSAAQNSESPVSTNVGPLPGGVGSVAARTNPYTNDAVALQDGWRLFNWYNCSGCHGGHAGGGMGPSLRDPVWIYGSRDDQIFDSIAAGRANGMPSWASKIPEDQIWQLVAYIKSMRTPEEPNPPVEPADEMVNESGPDTPPVAKAPHHP